MNEFPLKEAQLSIVPNEFIVSWDYVTDDEQDGKWRIYYKPIDHSSGCNKTDCQHGFYFYCVEWAGNNTSNPTWSPETYINTLYHGVAYFDGLRHVYLGKDDDGIYGYTNYPNASIHIEIWKALNELEKRFCDLDI